MPPQPARVCPPPPPPEAAAMAAAVSRTRLPAAAVVPGRRAAEAAAGAPCFAAAVPAFLAAAAGAQGTEGGRALAEYAAEGWGRRAFGVGERAGGEGRAFGKGLECGAGFGGGGVGGLSRSGVLWHCASGVLVDADCCGSVVRNTYFLRHGQADIARVARSVVPNGRRGTVLEQYRAWLRDLEEVIPGRKPRVGSVAPDVLAAWESLDCLWLKATQTLGVTKRKVFEFAEVFLDEHYRQTVALLEAKAPCERGAARTQLAGCLRAVLRCVFLMNLLPWRDGRGWDTASERGLEWRKDFYGAAVGRVRATRPDLQALLRALKSYMRTARGLELHGYSVLEYIAPAEEAVAMYTRVVERQRFGVPRVTAEVGAELKGRLNSIRSAVSVARALTRCYLLNRELNGHVKLFNFMREQRDYWPQAVAALVRRCNDRYNHKLDGILSAWVDKAKPGSPQRAVRRFVGREVFENANQLLCLAWSVTSGDTLAAAIRATVDAAWENWEVESARIACECNEVSARRAERNRCHASRSNLINGGSLYSFAAQVLSDDFAFMLSKSGGNLRMFVCPLPMSTSTQCT